jgi:hypothetical protein
LAFSALGLMLAAAGSASAGIQTFILPMDGGQEVPGPGDPDGFGTATLMIDDVNLTIDWLFAVSDITLPLSGAHIHVGAFGASGSPVVNFNAQLSGSGLSDPDLAAVLANPPGYYVNLHNADYPGGAIRGQIPEPASLALLGLGAAATLRRRRRMA